MNTVKIFVVTQAVLLLQCKSCAHNIPKAAKPKLSELMVTPLYLVLIVAKIGHKKVFIYIDKFLRSVDRILSLFLNIFYFPGWNVFISLNIDSDKTAHLD